jgi:hypothetical protein
MASTAALDLAKLVALIPGPKLTGRDRRDELSPNSAYHAIKDARCDPSRAQAPHAGGIQIGLADGRMHTVCSSRRAKLQETAVLGGARTAANRLGSRGPLGTCIFQGSLPSIRRPFHDHQIGRGSFRC